MPDPSFRARILARLFRPTCTRAAISEALDTLTGREPIIIEPWSNGDCGSWSSLSHQYGGNVAYGVAGAWGSLQLPGRAAQAEAWYRALLSEQGTSTEPI